VSNDTVVVATALAPLGKLRELLALLAALREIRDPIATPIGLRQTIAVLIRLAELAGIEPAWIDRLRTILADPAVFNIVLAIVQYVFGLVETDEVSARGQVEILAEAEFAEWLPIAIQVIGLARQL
jgi:hypothetical protein